MEPAKNAQSERSLKSLHVLWGGSDTSLILCSYVLPALPWQWQQIEKQMVSYTAEEDPAAPGLPRKAVRKLKADFSNHSPPPT